MPTTSRWTTSFAGARATFTSHYMPTTSWKYAHRLLNIRGIAFFDVYHGQLGAAPNGIELQPVTGLTPH